MGSRIKLAKIVKNSLIRKLSLQLYGKSKRTSPSLLEKLSSAFLK